MNKRRWTDQENQYLKDNIHQIRKQLNMKYMTVYQIVRRLLINN